MSHAWIYGPRCGIDNCRARKYAVGDDGFKYCARGHQAADQLIGDDDAYMGAGAKKTKRSADEDADKPLKYLQGREALELFLQCFQLLLRKQVWWLIHEKGFPSEMEAVVKDLWAFKIRMLEPLLQDPDKKTRLFSSQQSSRAVSHASLGSSQPSSVDESSDERLDADPDSSLDEEHSRIKHRSQRPRLIDSLGIIYLAALLLRLPISVSDAHSWIISPRFPFMRALDSIPLTMKQVLPQTMLKALDTRIGIPDPGKIHLVTISVAASYAAAFDMQIPKINHDLLLVRHMTNLALPLDVFSFTQQLARLLNVSYAMPTWTRNRTTLFAHPEIQLVGLLCVAVKLLYPFDQLPRPPHTSNEQAALILPWQEWNAIHASECSSIPSRSLGSPPSATISYPTLHDRHELSGGFGQATPNEAGFLSTSEADVLSMSGPEMDNYMAWFRQTWLPNDGAEEDLATQDTSDFLKAVWALFPVGDSTRTPTVDTPSDSAPTKATNKLTGSHKTHGNSLQESLAFVRSLQARLQPVVPISDADAAAAAPDDDPVLRAGCAYVHYRTVAEIPGAGRPFFDAVARTVCLSLEQLMHIVFALEMKVVNWARGRSRTSEQTHEVAQDTDDASLGLGAGNDYDAMSLDLSDNDL